MQAGIESRTSSLVGNGVIPGTSCQIRRRCNNFICGESGTFLWVVLDIGLLCHFYIYIYIYIYIADKNSALIIGFPIHYSEVLS